MTARCLPVIAAQAEFSALMLQQYERFKWHLVFLLGGWLLRSRVGIISAIQRVAAAQQIRTARFSSGRIPQRERGEC